MFLFGRFLVFKAEIAIKFNACLFHIVELLGKDFIVRPASLVDILEHGSHDLGPCHFCDSRYVVRFGFDSEYVWYGRLAAAVADVWLCIIFRKHNFKAGL